MSTSIDSLNISGLKKSELQQLKNYIDFFDDEFNEGWFYYGCRKHWDNRHKNIMKIIRDQIDDICKSNDYVIQNEAGR